MRHSSAPAASNRPQRLLASQVEAMQGRGDNAAFTGEVGHAVALAILAFGDHGLYRDGAAAAARCATSPTASAAATRSATCST